MKFTGERFVPADNLLEDEIGYEHLHRYYAATKLVKDKDVLDLASGEGFGSAILAVHANSVAGVDIDEESIRWAAEKYTKSFPRLSFSQGSAAAIPFANHSFDVVISFETIEHLNIAAQEQFMQEIKRVLRNGGLLIMSTPDKKNYSDRYKHENSFHIKEFYREEFIQFVNNHFANAAFFDQGYEVVSVISNPAAEKEDTISLYSWKEKNTRERKYIIAVASDSALPLYSNAFSSIVPETDKDFLFLMDRLILMNEEIESLGQWGQTLDKNMQEAQKTIQEGTALASQNVQLLKQKENILLKQSLTIKTLDAAKTKMAAEKEQWQQKLQEKELLAAELSEKLHQLYQENNRTKERLSEIYRSDGWKLLNRYYKLKGKMLPEDSKRYKRLKKIFNQLRFKGATKNNAGSAIETDARSFSKVLLPVSFEPLTLPAFDYPAVSIIIPAYNAWEMNYQCIESIITNTAGVAYEVLLADDCSEDGTKNCADVITNLVHIRSEQNLGFLKNCNYAAGFAKGKYILFLNNDTKVKANWLAPMVSLMERDQSAGMVGAKLIYPDGKLQEAGGIIWNDASGWNYGHKQDPELPEFNYVKEADYISGACILIRKEIWLKTGGFDERYSPAYYEDTDFAFTLRSLGYKVMYQPLSEVIHYEGYSHGNDNSLEKDGGQVKAYQKINNGKFFQKWQQQLTREQLPNAQNVFQARDRTLHKKTILVIDHYVPHIDKDAGSKSTFQYLELFASLGLNIKFIGDNFFKHEPYTTTLQQMGIEVLYGTWYHNNWQQWVKDNSQHIHYVLINRPHISIKYIDFLKEFTNARILYYGHDLHFRREQMQYDIEKDPKLLKSAEKWKETEQYLFEKSDIILTPSEEERAIIAALNSSFRVDTILLYFFTKPATPVIDFADRENILFVGGFGHKPNLDAVEWFSKQVWPAVSAALPSAKFIIVGSNPPEAVTSLQSDSIEVRGFVSEKELLSIYSKVKLVVIPLRYGAGVKGKTLEAMYNGLPVVTTDFGIQGMQGDYQAFLHPKNDARAFADEITRLYSDSDELQKQSVAGTGYINTNFTYKAAADKVKGWLGINE